ncbi:MAG: RNA polymerase sigma factor [Fibrobacteria bacterium]
MMETKSANPFEEVNSKAFLEALVGGGAKAQKAFAELFGATHERILNYVRRYLGSVDECQEVLQETYLAVHKGISKFESKSKLTTWIYSLAYHKTCDRMSEKDRNHLEFNEERMALATGESTPSALFDDISPWDMASDAVAEKRRLEGLISQAIESLPLALRHVYQLRDEEGLSGEEIAVMLGMPSSTVRVHLHRARNQIVQSVQEKLTRKAFKAPEDFKTKSQSAEVVKP